MSVRALVTGASGFVGRHLVAALTEAGDTAISSSADITDRDALVQEFADAQPDVVYHLAAQADVGGSWDRPIETFRVNAEGTMNVLDAARLCGADRVVAVTSADLYGKVSDADMPLTRSAAPAPGESLRAHPRPPPT